jgi:hypothetical protein
VQISAVSSLTIRNAKGIVFKNSTVSVTSGRAYNAENAEVEGLNGKN